MSKSYSKLRRKYFFNRRFLMIKYCYAFRKYKRTQTDIAKVIVIYPFPDCWPRKEKNMSRNQLP